MNKILVSLMLIGLTGGAAFALPSMSALQAACTGVKIDDMCVPHNPCANDAWRSYCAKVFADIEIADPDVADRLARMVIKDVYPNVPDAQIEQNMEGTSVNNVLGQDYIAYKIGDKAYLQFEFGDTHDYTNTDNIKNVVMAVCHYMQADMTEFTHEKGNYTLATCDVEANSKTCKEIMSALKTVDPQHFTDRLKKTDNEKCTFVQEYL